MHGILLWLMRGPQKWIILILVAAVGVSNALVLWYWLARLYLDADPKAANEYLDSLHMAVELGRLDVISALLALVAFILGSFALVSFGYIRYRAEKVADQTAREVAEEWLKRRGPDDSNRSTKPEGAATVDDVDVSSVEDEEADDNDS